MNFAYCGNCNPAIDTPALRKQLEALSKGDDKDVLVLLNGCRVGCLKCRERQGDFRFCLTVSGLSVDMGEVVDESLLADAVLRRLRQLRAEF